jgi:hypothetical protein
MDGLGGADRGVRATQMGRLSRIKNFFVSLFISQKKGDQQIAAAADKPLVLTDTLSLKARGIHVGALAESGDVEELPDDVDAAAEKLRNAVDGKIRRFGANHDAKIEILRYVAEGDQFPVAFEALVQFARENPQYRSLIASALGSAMGGAEWTKDPEDNYEAIDLSANAMKAFMRLNQAGVLKDPDNKCVLGELGTQETNALQDPQSPFWPATQRLSLERRTELADYLSPLPQEIYAESRRYLRLQMELKQLEGLLKKPIQDDTLRELRNVCSKHCGVDLLENGCEVPRITDVGIPEEVRARIGQELEKLQVQNALGEIQILLGKYGRRLQKLRESTATLNEALQPYVKKGHNDLVNADAPIPEAELALRRNILAGKPGATANECLAVMGEGTNFISYAQCESMVKKAGQQKQSLFKDMKGIMDEGTQPPDLNRAKCCAQAISSFVRSYREGLMSFRRIRKMCNFHRVGDLLKKVPLDYSLLSSIVSGGFKATLEKTMFGVLPEIKEKVDLEGGDYSGTVKAFQKVLDGPEQYGLGAGQIPPELRELMTTAQEIIKVMG